MRTIINFLFLFTSLSTLSQNEDILAFGERFKPLEFPLVFDDLSVLDIKRHPEIPYSLFQKIIIDDDGSCLIKTNDTINNKFFANGKINVFDKYVGFIFTHISNYKGNAETKIYLSVFNDNRLLRTNLLANPYPESETKINSLLFKNIFYEFKNLNSNNSETTTYSRKGKLYDGMKKEDGFIFSEEVFSEDFGTDSLHAGMDSIPERNLNLNFNKDFFKSKKELIPLKYCSPISNSQVLTSIDGLKKKNINSFFIDSWRIKDNRKIIFFMNEYEYDKFKCVSEIGYFIIDSKGKIKMKKSFAEYILRDNGERFKIKEAKIISNSKRLKIISFEAGVSEIESFDLDMQAEDGH
ncbi:MULTISPECIES: hypothetical protein [unclassified Flavobacterium]|uniref:hypothetical protein n=1 Tax=unclassified Flavobacterium TaxID=196869 RepID=UPI000969686F|nr:MULTISPECIES: hypothetical protein [unclassified Flavobacterium]MBN9285323.1 hypothetical protein [Flavobacterium sp.]OJV73212.1 MAG: hypothetical protein BGO42_14710 [Flavobacterium sp. 40-81]